MKSAPPKVVPPGLGKLRVNLTRIECPSLLVFARTLVAYWVLRRQVFRVPGIVEAGILLRRPRTLVLISVWDSDDAIVEFNTSVIDHVRGVNWLYATGSRVWSCRLRVDQPSHMSRSMLWRRDGIGELHPS
jgi:hypothetical protein